MKVRSLQGATPMRSLTTHTHALLKSKAVPKRVRYVSVPNCRTLLPHISQK